MAIAVPAAVLSGEGGAVPATAEAVVHRVKVERTVRLPAGVAKRSFRFRLRASYADRVRLVVPRGAAVSVLARTVDGLMGIGVSTRPRQGQCRHGRSVDICDQPQEWCPLSDYRWRVTVRKASAAPVLARVRFVFVRQRR
jgi:hypothetical protein